MTNQLTKASSPYLLQHANNPVHWREWGPEALIEAQTANKPILLSIGYAACHWCHVMAHESFEDPATADVMNELFINIKVDREERPDIDHVYMSALHAQGQQGGWPLTMFLTPTGAPFWGGTYFPKQARFGRPSFVTVLERVAASFRDNPSGIAQNAAALTPAIASPRPVDAAQFDDSLLLSAGRQMAAAFDPLHGGFRGAPKFPNAPVLEFMTRIGQRTGSAGILTPVLTTLERMSQGGIYDHLGGGFARYSVDERWLAPHFEKMLYDNAQLLELLAAASQLTKNPVFKARALETIAWLQSEMTHAGGAFFASLDADSEGVEGKFYVWTANEIAAILGAEDAAFFGAHYDATPQGNWRDDHGGPSMTILNRLSDTQTTETEEQRLKDLRARLLRVRGRRVRPGLDDKILADWNGLMINALVRAAQVFSAPQFIKLAAAAFDFIAGSMSYVDTDGGRRLAHSWRNECRQPAGFASDYVFMARAALALHEVIADPNQPYLQFAKDWLETVHARHWDEEHRLLFTAASDVSDVPVRLAPTNDDAVPNPHGHYAMALIELAAHSGQIVWRDRADAVLLAAASQMAAHPYGHSSLLSAFDYRRNVREIAVFGPDAGLPFDPATLPFQTRIIIHGDTRPELRSKSIVGSFVVVCHNDVCSAPIRTTDEFEEFLQART